MKKECATPRIKLFYYGYVVYDKFTDKWVEDTLAWSREECLEKFWLVAKLSGETPPVKNNWWKSRRELYKICRVRMSLHKHGKYTSR